MMMKNSVSLTRTEKTLGALYVLVQFLILPPAFSLLTQALTLPLWGKNMLYFSLNFLAALLIYRKFLFGSLKAAVKNPWGIIRWAGFGLLLYYISSFCLNKIIYTLYPDFLNLNDRQVSDIFQQQAALIGFATVILVPIGEEALFRGLIFRGLFDRHPILAYLLSTLGFAYAHCANHIGQYSLPHFLLSFLQYIPAGLCLCYAYHRSGNITAPILMHITINQISVQALR